MSGTVDRCRPKSHFVRLRVAYTRERIPRETVISPAALVYDHPDVVHMSGPDTGGHRNNIGYIDAPTSRYRVIP